MTDIVASVLTFLAVFITVVSVYSVTADVFLRDRSAVKHRLDAEFRAHLRQRVQRTSLFKDLANVAADVSSQDGGKIGLWRRLEEMVEQSGLSIQPRHLLAIAGGLALVLGALGVLANHGPFLGILLALVGGVAPYVYVSRKRNTRLDRLLNQLPEAFDLMGRVIRAGQAVGQAMHAVADEFETPIAAEFAFCSEQQNLGMPVQQSLRELARRNGLAELKIFVVAMLVQQQTGGNLAEALGILAGVIRERLRLQSRIKTLTAEGRFQAATLMVMPPLMWFVMFALNRNYAMMLFERPLLPISGAVLMAIGAAWIREITRIEV